MNPSNNETEHSRFNPDHYNNCSDCYDAHLDFIDESNRDAELDEQIERGDDEHEYDQSY